AIAGTSSPRRRGPVASIPGGAPGGAGEEADGLPSAGCAPCDGETGDGPVERAGEADGVPPRGAEDGSAGGAGDCRVGEVGDRRPEAVDAAGYSKRGRWSKRWIGPVSGRKGLPPGEGSNSPPPGRRITVSSSASEGGTSWTSASPSASVGGASRSTVSSSGRSSPEPSGTVSSASPGR